MDETAPVTCKVADFGLSRHFDPAWRRAGAWRGAAAVLRCDLDRLDELDQVGDRPSARRRRGSREHLLHPRAARPDRPADAQPRQSVGELRRRRSGALYGPIGGVGNVVGLSTSVIHSSTESADEAQ